MPSLYTAGASIRSMEQLADNDSIIHKLPPTAKLIITLVYVVLVISHSRYDVQNLLPFALYIAIIMPISHTPCKALLKRLLIALPFALFGGLANLFLDRDTAFIILNIHISYGLVSFIAILLKAVLTVTAILLLIATTTVSDISDSLIRLKVPSIFVLSLLMTYRYISVLLEEAATMYTAYSLRSPNTKGIKMRDMGTFIGQLLLRSIDRASSIYVAMKCRGFNGLYRPAHKAGLGLPYIACVCGILLILRLV